MYPIPLNALTHASTSMHVRAGMYEQACAHALPHESCSNIYSKNMIAGAPSLQLPRLRFELFHQLVKERDGHGDTGDSSQASL